MTNTIHIARQLPYRRNRGRSTVLVHNLLAKFCGYTDRKAKRMVVNNDCFNQVTAESIKKSYKVLEDAKYTYFCQFHPEILSIPCQTLRRQIEFLNDCGVDQKQTVRLMFNFKSILKKPISELKSFGILPLDINVAETFRSRLNLTEMKFPVEYEESDTLREVYNRFYEIYVKQELDISDSVWNNLHYKRKYVWNSFKMLKNNMKVVKNVIGYNEKHLQKALSLLEADSENLLSIIKSFPQVQIKDLLQKHTFLSLIPNTRLAGKLKMLEENNIPFETLFTNPSLLKLRDELIKYRISAVMNSNTLKIYINHPRFLTLVYRSYIAKERLLILRKMNMKCYTLNLLCTTETSFMQHVNIGIDKVPSKDLFMFLSKQLNTTIGEVRRRLKKNPNLGYIPLTTVMETVAYLKETGFESNDIFFVLQIVLYNWEVIAEAVRITNEKHPTVVGSIEKKIYLSLVLYNLEKNCYFSGSGVWAKSNRADVVEDVYTIEN